VEFYITNKEIAKNMTKVISERIQQQLDCVNAKLEHWEYRTLSAVRFIGIELLNGDDWADVRAKSTIVLDKMPENASGFDYDLTFMHHFGKKVDDVHCHTYIGRFMKMDTPVPEGFAHWDFMPDDSNTPYLTFRSQFAFSVLSGDHDAMHNGEGFDVNALYDITRNIILEDGIVIPYPEIYWTAEVQFDRADGTSYNPQNLYREDNDFACGFLFSICH